MKEWFTHQVKINIVGKRSYLVDQVQKFLYRNKTRGTFRFRAERAVKVTYVGDFEIGFLKRFAGFFPILSFLSGNRYFLFSIPKNKGKQKGFC